jgi:hypothetical protein
VKLPEKLGALVLTANRLLKELAVAVFRRNNLNEAPLI